MNTQSIIVVLVVGLVVLVPLWTVFAVRRRYGAEASKFSWWWLWSRIGCNGIMGAGVALSVFGVWAETQGIKDPSWVGVLFLVLMTAFFCVLGVIFLLNKKPTESLYQESSLLVSIWFVVICIVVAMRLVNIDLSVHVENGLLLTGFGAVFTRFLKNWI